MTFGGLGDLHRDIINGFIFKSFKISNPKVNDNRIKIHNKLYTKASITLAVQGAKGMAFWEQR